MSLSARNSAFAQATPRSVEPWRRFAQVVVLVLAGFWVYAPALHGDWLWDDGATIKDNALMANPMGWWKFWFKPPGPDYFPLTSNVEWGLWRVFGDHTLPYHLASLALHLFSAFLIWRLFAKVGLRLAWLGALLFAIHPLAVESVAWISELKNTVSLPPLLLSLLFWLRYDERGQPGDRAISLLLFLAALLAKTSVVMLPFVLLLHAWWKYGSLTRRDIRTAAPYFVISLVLGILTVCFQQQWAIGEDKIDIGWPARAAGAGWAVFFYLGKCLWPVGLLPAYPPWDFSNFSPGQFSPWVGLAAGFVILWRRRAGWGRGVLFGLGFFLLNLAPVLGFLTMSYMHIAWVADHFVYLPMIGLIGLAVAGADKIGGALSRSGRVVATGIVALLAFVLAWSSRQYAENFNGQPALWAHTLQKTPDSWLASMNLGLSLADAGRVPEGEAWLKKSIERKDDFYGTHLILANIFLETNQLDQAATHYRTAWRLHPQSLEVHINYGYLLVRQGDLKGAADQYYLALLFHADSVVAHVDYGNVLARLNRDDEARAEFEAALALDPRQAAAQTGLEKLRAKPPAEKPK